MDRKIAVKFDNFMSCNITSHCVLVKTKVKYQEEKNTITYRDVLLLKTIHRNWARFELWLNILCTMAIRVVEFSREGYKVKKGFWLKNQLKIKRFKIDVIKKVNSKKGTLKLILFNEKKDSERIG